MYLALYYHIEYSSALKIVCVLPIHPSLAQHLAPTDLFIVSIILLFPECHIVFGIIHYITFSDWFISLSKMHLRFLHVLSWLDSSFLVSTE